MFDVSYECQDCEKVYWATKTYNRKQSDESAKRRLMIHLRTCKPAEKPKVKESIKASNTRGYCNCPVCNEVTRADRIVGHCLSKHKDELAFSMGSEIRKEMRDLSLPILWGFEPYGKHAKGARCLFGCLHCKKGFFKHTKRPADFDVTNRKLLSDHKECLEHFKSHEHHFQDISEEPTVLPFVCKKYLEAEIKALLKKDEATGPVLEVKEAPKDAYSTSVAVLDLKEEVKRLKADLQKAQDELRASKTLSESVRTKIKDLVEPEEDLEDEDLLLEMTRSYESQLKINNRQRRVLNEMAAEKETVQDIFHNLLADDGFARLLKDTCTEEQVTLLGKYIQ